MLAVASFKNELARCLPPDSDEGTDAYVARWAKDKRAERTWAAIKKAAPTLQAPALIVAAIDARQRATRVVTPDRRRLASYRNTVKQKVLTSRSVSELLAALEQLVRTVRYEGGQCDERFIRQHKWREAEFFVHVVGSMLHSRCGRWFDKEVAVLGDIAFPGNPVDANQIKTWRKRRRQASLREPGRATCVGAILLS